MKINHYLDGGSTLNFKKFDTGQEIQTAVTEGVAAYAYPRGTKIRQWKVPGTFLSRDFHGWVTPAMGKFPAGSFRANELRARQFAEFVGNREMQACYIEWFAGGPIESEDQPDDGWYIITGFNIDYNMKVFGIITYEMEVTYVNPGNLRGHKMWWRGGKLSTNFSQVGVCLLATPIDTFMPLASITRSTLEGTVSLISAPTLASNPIRFNTTTPNLLKGGVHVFDTVIDSSRSNATPPTKTLKHGDMWIEAFGTDHRFLGDIVLTNGILMVVIPVMQQLNKIATVYWWDYVNTTWVLIGDLVWCDNTPTVGTLLSASVKKLGPNSTEVVLIEYTTAAEAEITIKLQRGQSFGRVDLRPLTVDNTTEYAIAFVPATAGWKTYNSATNSAAASGNLAVQTDYGFAAFYYGDASKHWTAGILYQNKPSTHQPIWTASTIGIGDTGQKVETSTSYGFFVVPDDDTETDEPDHTNASLTGPGNVAQQFLHLKSQRLALG